MNKKTLKNKTSIDELTYDYYQKQYLSFIATCPDLSFAAKYDNLYNGLKDMIKLFDVIPSEATLKKGIEAYLKEHKSENMNHSFYEIYKLNPNFKWDNEFTQKCFYLAFFIEKSSPRNNVLYSIREVSKKNLDAKTYADVLIEKMKRENTKYIGLPLYNIFSKSYLKSYTSSTSFDDDLLSELIERNKCDYAMAWINYTNDHSKKFTQSTMDKLYMHFIKEEKYASLTHYSKLTCISVSEDIKGMISMRISATNTKGDKI